MRSVLRRIQFDAKMDTVIAINSNSTPTKWLEDYSVIYRLGDESEYH